MVPKFTKVANLPDFTFVLLFKPIKANNTILILNLLFLNLMSSVNPLGLVLQKEIHPI